MVALASSAARSAPRVAEFAAVFAGSLGAGELVGGRQREGIASLGRTRIDRYGLGFVFAVLGGRRGAWLIRCRSVPVAVLFGV